VQPEELKGMAGACRWMWIDHSGSVTEKRKDLNGTRDPVERLKFGSILLYQFNIITVTSCSLLYSEGTRSYTSMPTSTQGSR
jgi:hypothetical protein